MTISRGISPLLLIMLALTAMVSSTASAADPCDDRGPNSRCKPYGGERYNTALATLNAAEVHTDFRGQGTTVVHMEPWTPRIDAYDRLSGRAIFGNCAVPRRKPADSAGWAPTGNNCRVKWVQCFGAARTGGGPCELITGRAQDHATIVAQGIATVAPDADIISLALPFEFSGRDYAAAVDWLLTPSDVFGGRSPAEYWNVVALNVSYPLLAAPIPDTKTWISGLFTGQCALENPDPAAEPQPGKYVDDWVRHHGREYDRAQYQGYLTHNAKLLAAGIIPVFGANNELTKRISKDAEGKRRTERFVSSLGIGFPGCLGNNVFVAAIAPDYPQRKNKWRFIGSNSHPELTTLVAPGGATSFSAPLVAGAVAVLRSPGLAPAATPEEIQGYLRDPAAPRAPAGISCVPVQDAFPDGANPALGCVEGALPYELPVLDLPAAVAAALAGQE